MKKNLILFLLLLAGSTGMIQAQDATAKTEAHRQDPVHASAFNALTHGHFVRQAEEVISFSFVSALLSISTPLAGKRSGRGTQKKQTYLVANSFKTLQARSAL